MRNIIPIVFVAATVLVGCHSPATVHTQTATPAVAAPPPFRPMLITMLGTNTTPDGTWRIGVSEHSLDLSRSASAHGEGWTSSGWTTTGFGTDSPWTSHEGWFVFIESESRVWAYDGDRALYLLTATANGGNSSSGVCGPSRFPCAVPIQVFSRLSEPAQRAIEPHV
jgi:hypothetical protein